MNHQNWNKSLHPSVHRLIASLVDLLPVIPAISAAAWTRSAGDDDPFFAIIYFSPLLLALWALFRLRVYAFELADPVKRAELALTALPSRDYLRPFLRGWLVRFSGLFLIPVAVQVSMMVLKLLRSGLPKEALVFHLELEFALAACTAGLGTFAAADMLVRICRVSNPAARSGWSCWFAWSLILVGSNVALALGLVAYAEGAAIVRNSHLAVLIHLILCFLLGLAALLLFFFAARRIQTLYSAYYDFD